MSNLFEVVFESVPKNNVLEFLSYLIPEPRIIVNYQFSEKNQLINTNEYAEALRYFLNFYGDISIIINLDHIKIDDLILPEILLRLVKYGQQYDIDYNFDLNLIKDTPIPDLVKKIHNHTKNIAKDNGISNFFGGMEPASDESTRYFTNNNLGPLVASKV